MKLRFHAAVAVLLLAGCAGSDDVAERVDEAQLAALFPDIVDYQPSYPPGTCMTDEEIRADQLTKLRTEMMITGLSCPAQYRDPDLYARYVGFTTSHQDWIRDSQDTLGRVLQRSQRGNPERLFDSYLTEMANNESQNVSKVSTARYCQARWQQFNAVSQFDDEDLQHYLDVAVDHYRDRYRTCD